MGSNPRPFFSSARAFDAWWAHLWSVTKAGQGSRNALGEVQLLFDPEYPHFLYVFDGGRFAPVRRGPAGDADYIFRSGRSAGRSCPVSLVRTTSHVSNAPAVVGGKTIEEARACLREYLGRVHIPMLAREGARVSVAFTPSSPVYRTRRVVRVLQAGAWIEVKALYGHVFCACAVRPVAGGEDAPVEIALWDEQGSLLKWKGKEGWRYAPSLFFAPELVREEVLAALGYQVREGQKAEA